MESPKTKKRASKNLNKILNAIGMSPVELSKDSGVSKSALNHYLKGDLVPSQENAEKMAAVLKVSPLWLMGIQKNMIPEQPVVSDGAVQIKVLGRVAAGIPIEAVTEYIDTEEIPAKMAQSGDYFGLQIHGDSMEPRMREGDVVIVRQQDDAENGDIVIAMVNGSDATCKRLTKYAGGIGLISLNPNYDPMMFTDQEIVDKPVRIIGKVVELRAKF
ncbi:helix-turn-helix domain-containing protein [Lachnospiraceae bacterium WCA3-601-WT-6H]|uniref:Helix-turn-helix domain-containing protein n=2 Tax=Waltera intestinalis TaxID=2606635 RepID=A0A6L5YG95_9FIRM|nr:helix-turn-helix domain-containing protein [Waltera intestinalis]